MSTRKRITCGIAVATLAASVVLTGCGSDGGGKAVTPENSVVATPPQRRGTEDMTGGQQRPMPPGAPRGGVGPGAPGGAGGR